MEKTLFLLHARIQFVQQLINISYEITKKTAGEHHSANAEHNLFRRFRSNITIAYGDYSCGNEVNRINIFLPTRINIQFCVAPPSGLVHRISALSYNVPEASERMNHCEKLENQHQKMGDLLHAVAVLKKSFL